MALTLDEIKTAESAPGFDLAKAAQAATIAPPNPNAPVPSNFLTTDFKSPAALPTPDPTPFVGSISDSQKYFQDLYNKQAADFETAKKERDSLRTLLQTNYDKLNSYGDVYKQTESDLGIPKMYEDLNKLNLQAADLTGAYDKEYARLETKGIQSGTPAVFFQGEQAAVQRQKAVEIGAIGVRQAAMAGNLELANKRAERVVELQFKPIENKIKQTLEFLAMNADDMTAAERRQASTLQNALTFQAQALQQQKEDKTNALMAGVSSKFFKYPGSELVYDTATGEAVTYDQYIAKGGKSDFSNITQINPMETQQVLQIMSQYPDAGINPSDTLASATAKLRNSRIYQEKVRPPQGSGTSTGLTGMNIVDKNIDAQVKGLIQSNINSGYGNTYEAVKKQFGKQVANSYDKVYQSVFNNGASVDAAFNDAKIAIAKTPTTEEQKKLDEAQTAKVMGQAQSKANIDLATSLLKSKGLNSAVGPNWLARASVVNNLSGARSNFISGVEQLTSQLSLDSLIRAKGQGATFGALSDSELRILSSSASKIGSWVTKNKNGVVSGYSVNEKEFRKELDKINNFAKLDYVLKGGNPDDVGVKIMPDGSYMTQNSDGTFTKLQ